MNRFQNLLYNFLEHRRPCFPRGHRPGPFPEYKKAACHRWKGGLPALAVPRNASDRLYAGPPRTALSPCYSGHTLTTSYKPGPCPRVPALSSYASTFPPGWRRRFEIIIMSPTAACLLQAVCCGDRTPSETAPRRRQRWGNSPSSSIGFYSEGLEGIGKVEAKHATTGRRPQSCRAWHLRNER